MSADWFCKIGEKKVGPFNGQQLKTIVAKGQLKPEHLVRRGSEGPWVPAGRIKGLFPEGTAAGAASHGKQPAKAGAKKPGTPPKAKGLPAATEAPAPPAADIPQELTLGGHNKHHVQMNVDKLNIDAMPVDVSRRKVKTGLKGLKKEDQKKLTVMLWCFGGGGILIGAIVLVSAWLSGKLSSPKNDVPRDPMTAAQPVDSGNKTAKDSADKKPAVDKEKDKPKEPTKVQVAMTVGNVELMILKPTRGKPPAEAKTAESEVLTVPVRLYLKEGEKKPIELKNWADESFHSKVSLKDDQKKTYDLLAQVAEKDGDGKTIREKDKKWLIVNLVFEAPTNTKLKSLDLKLPSAAFQAGGPIMDFEISASDIREAAKPAETDKTADSEESATKSDKK